MAAGGSSTMVTPDEGPVLLPRSSDPEYKQGGLGFWQSLCCRALKCGHVPHHIAFIMDGNRRFARKNQLKHSLGHVLGFDKLTETLDWCLNLGVEEVTVYAFSIENFKRTKEEVDCLMELAKKKFEKLMEEKDVLMQHDVRVRVLGDLHRLPREVMVAVARAVNYTKENTRAKLNVCFAYTSRCEMAEAARRVAWGVEEGLIQPADVNEDLFEKCLYTEDSPPCDLLIRTSGEVRLSDFLLWQSSYSCLCFQDVLWPEYSLWNLAAAVLSYQRNHDSIVVGRQRYYEERKRRVADGDRQCAVAEAAGKRCDRPGLSGAHPAGSVEEESGNIDCLVADYAEAREKRCALFLSVLRKKQEDYIDELCSGNN